MLVLKPSTNVCSSNEQSHLVLWSNEYHVNHDVMYKEKAETSRWEYQGNVIYMEDDKNCQVNMLSVKPPMMTRNVNLPRFTRTQRI